MHTFTDFENKEQRQNFPVKFQVVYIICYVAVKNLNLKRRHIWRDFTETELVIFTENLI
jgi:hypothetical protein